MLLFGISFSSILIYWLVSTLQNLTSKSGIISFLLNGLIILSILGIVFKLLSSSDIVNKSPFYTLFLNIILYIPCLFINLIDFFIEMMFPTSSTSTQNLVHFVLLLIVVFVYVIYFKMMPYMESRMVKQG